MDKDVNKDDNKFIEGVNKYNTKKEENKNMDEDDKAWTLSTIGRQGHDLDSTTKIK